MTKRRECQQCGKNRAEKFFTSERGRICATCRKKNRSDATHARRVETTYGLTSEQYQTLLDHQGGTCAICGGTRNYRLNVDHDHKTGLTRGLLCRRCNKLLRDARDDVEVFRGGIRYLQSPPAQDLGIVAIAKDN